MRYRREVYLIRWVRY